MRKFDIPNKFRSNFITNIKTERKIHDKMKKDFSPTIIEFPTHSFLLSRHFGFCFGVENAIEVAYKTLNQNPNKRIFLLSEMIHNPDVNKDLEENGILFIQDTYGKNLISWDSINSEDVVIIPAFGTTVETETLLKSKGINPLTYNTTCPFVEKVWNRSREISLNNYTTIIHGKFLHEETRATFSHTKLHGKAIVILNIDEAQLVASYIKEEINKNQFLEYFRGKFSVGFNPQTDLDKIGVVNQTTMLAEETMEISDLLKNTMIEKYGKSNINQHFADTRDTLCYATNDNQTATKELLNSDVDFAIVVGGYNSSNTTHLVEILSQKIKTYFIANENEIKSENEIHYFDYKSKQIVIENNFLTAFNKPSIAITAGASCPDSEIEKVINKISSYFGENKNPEIFS